MTHLQTRAATALDLTHGKLMVGLKTEQVRDLLAAWLDGRKFKSSTVRKLVAYLEMIARYRESHS